MELYIDNAHTPHVAMCDLSAALSGTERVLQLGTADVGAKTPSFKIPLLETVVTTSKETGTSVIERVMAVHKDTKATKDIAGTAVENDSNATDCKLQLLLRSVIKPPSDM